MDTEPLTPWPDTETASANPDYVALVIEWVDDDGEVVHASDDEVTREVTRMPARSALPSLARILAAVGGVLGALALARWGARRLRHA